MFSLEDVIKIIVFIAGLLGVWYSLKYKVDRIDKCTEDMGKAIDTLKKSTDDEIKGLELKVDNNNNAVNIKLDALKDDIHSKHIKLLEAINAKK